MTTSKFILRLGAIACAAALQLQAADKASYISGSCHQVDAGMLAGFNLPS